MSDWWSADPVYKPSGRPHITVTSRDRVYSSDQSSPLDPPSKQDRDLAIRTMLAEAGNQGQRGLQAVGSVIRNRAVAGNYGGDTPSGVVTARNQFEPWNTEQGRQKMAAIDPGSPQYQQAAQALEQAYAGQDPTNGAVNFIAPKAQAALGRSMPGWAQGPGQDIGDHRFFGGATDISAQSRQPTGDWWAKDPVAQPQQPQPAPQQPTVGMGDAIARGVQSGVTFNFGDELRGLLAAGGGKVGSDTEPAGPHNAVIGAYKLLISGDPEARRIYEETVAKERAANKQAEEQRPYSYGAGTVGGAVAIPVGGMMGAATLPVRMARGAGVGAGMGALSGAGEGENTVDRLGRAATGAAVGGAVGGVAPPIVEGVLQAGRAAVNPIVNAVRGAVNPEAEASRRVTNALMRDMQADPNAVGRLNPQEFAASVQSGGPARIMDIGGETTRGLARSAANTSPEGRQVLNQTINDRFEGQTGRVSDWLRGTFHYPNADAQQQALEQTARNVNRGAYARAYRDGADGVWTPELERLAGSSEVSAAMQAAANKSGSESIVSGYGAMNPRVSFTQDGRIQFNRAPNGTPTYPDLQFWDLARRELSDAAQRAGRGTSEARRLGELARMMNTELDRAVPSYAQARAGAASFFGAENALEAGQNFVTQNFATAEVRRNLARMSEQERQLFQDGFVSRFVETLEKTGDRRNVLNTIASSPAAREKLHIALGRQRAAEMEAGLRIEGIVDLARGAVQGNSTTARQLAEIGLAGGTGATGIAGVYNQDPGTLTIAAVSAALLAGKRGIDTRVARNVAEMLVSDRPEVLMRGVHIVARNGRFLENLRRIDGKIAQLGAAESPKGAFAVQSISPGRAEGEQPNVQGPRGQ